MEIRLLHSLSACATLTAALASAPPALAADPVAIRWEQLIPAAQRHTESAALMAKLLPPGQTTGRAAVSVSPQADLVRAYDGARVRLTGFVLPFNNEAPPYKRLLLIPFSGACVKFPPPRNQAVLVTVADGIALDSFHEVVAVTGTMRVESAQTDIAEAGYTIAAEAIAPAE